jgi:hypothetical protein
LRAFKDKKSDSIEFQGNIQEIVDIIPQDVVLGLLLSNFVPRLRFLLQNGLDMAAEQRAYFCLQVIAMHSVSSAEDILACSGLIDIVLETIFQSDFPSSHSAGRIISGLRVIRAVARSSVDASRALAEAGIPERLMKFLSLTPTLLNSERVDLKFNGDFKLQDEIATNVLGILSIMFSHGHCSSILDTHYLLLMEYFRYCCLNFQSFGTGLSALLQCFCEALRSFGEKLSIGGFNDSFSSVLDLLLKVFEFQKSNDNEILKLNAMNFLLQYFKAGFRFVGQNTLEFLERSREISKLLTAFDFNSYFKNAIESMPNWNDFKNPGLGRGFAFQKLDDMNNVSKLLEVTIKCDCFTAIAKLAAFIHSIDEHYNPSSLISQFQFNDWETALNYSSFELGWYSIWGHGVVQFVSLWVSILPRVSKNSDPNSKLAIETWLAQNALPGDESMVDTLFSNYSGFKNMVMFSRNSVTRSYQIWGDTLTSSLASTMFSAEESKLPLPPQFLYTILESNFPDCRCEPSYIINWLEILIKLESVCHKSLAQENETVLKLMQLMKVFLYTDADGRELFHCDEIRDSLQRILDIITSKSSPSNVVFDYAIFSATYEQLLDTFDSCSFGNSCFAAYILLPLTKYNNPKFQNQFWTKMTPQIRIMTLNENEIAWKVSDYFSPFRGKYQGLMRHAVQRKSIDSERNPVIWKICEYSIKALDQ